MNDDVVLSVWVRPRDLHLVSAGEAFTGSLFPTGPALAMLTVPFQRCAVDTQTGAVVVGPAPAPESAVAASSQMHEYAIGVLRRLVTSFDENGSVMYWEGFVKARDEALRLVGPPRAVETSAGPVPLDAWSMDLRAKMAAGSSAPVVERIRNAFRYAMNTPDQVVSAPVVADAISLLEAFLGVKSDV